MLRIKFVVEILFCVFEQLFSIFKGEFCVNSVGQ